jgi:hypothetical protein
MDMGVDFMTDRSQTNSDSSSLRAQEQLLAPSLGSQSRSCCVGNRCSSMPHPRRGASQEQAAFAAGMEPSSSGQFPVQTVAGAQPEVVVGMRQSWCRIAPVLQDHDTGQPIPGG